ncbi:hypothetical protein FRC12_022563 [Ceratobasidium sp. 428]|nr:hypothetical protein FRC12_022563 [Ceratobasidium sp. 428]
MPLVQLTTLHGAIKTPVLDEGDFYFSSMTTSDFPVSPVALIFPKASFTSSQQVKISQLKENDRITVEFDSREFSELRVIQIEIEND